jgi:hypothetical protein
LRFQAPIPEWHDQLGFDQWLFQSAYNTCVRLTVPSALVDTTFLYCQKIPVKKLRVDSYSWFKHALDRFDSIHNVFALCPIPVSGISITKEFAYVPETNGFGRR